MTITLDPKLEAVLHEYARRQGIAAETLVLNALREKFPDLAPDLEPQDEWERIVLGVGADCGVSLSHAALSSEGVYE